MILFEREGDVIRAEFDELESTVIASLADQVALLIEVRPDGDAAVARLLPDAYRDDPAAQAEFRSLTESDLASRKAANARTLADGIRAETWPKRVELDESTAVRWMRALTDIRLVLAERIGVDDDGLMAAAASDADLAMQDAYHVLGALQESLVDAVGG